MTSVLADGLTMVFTFQYGATSTKYYWECYDSDSEFTFQYGATSTFSSILYLHVDSSFTFQYGATSTR